MNTIQTPAHLVGITPLKDGALSLRFYTQEMTAKEKLITLEYFQKFGWLLFKEDEKDFTEIDVPKENSGMDEGKSPQQRMRACLYVYWEKFKKDDLTFEEFYKREMERQINAIKEKLE